MKTNQYLNNPKVWKAWFMYDWANSVHNLVIITVIFPIYYHMTAVNEQGGDIITFLGYSINNDSLYSYTISAATFLLVFITPVLSGIADYAKGKKMLFMKIFCYLGAISTAYFFFFTKSNITFSVIAFGLSIIGWGGSVVFYNAYLPEIATEEHYDRLSAKGFAYGYAGSVLLLIVNLLLIQKPEFFGISSKAVSSGLTFRIAFLTVGLWWAGFAQIPFRYLPKSHNEKFEWLWLKNGIQQLQEVFLESRSNPLLKRFLTAFFLYDMGVMTTIYVSTIFADKVLQIPKTGLIITLLLIQLVAILGSFLSSYLSGKYGNSISLRIFIALWILVPLGAYFTYSPEPFYAIAALVGLVMGGIQSLSRSTFAKLIPDGTDKTTAYFSFYDITEKIAISLGSFLYGFILYLTGEMRNSVLFILILFISGFIMLFRIPSKHIYTDKVNH